MSNYFKKWRILALGIVLILELLLSWVWQVGPVFAETPKRGGLLTIATDDSAIGLDPHLSLAGSTIMFTEHVYDTLVRFGKNYELEPSLAVSWTQPDSLTYIFHLRKGVKFHNGMEMTSEDIKFNFDRILDPKSGAFGTATFSSIKSVEALDRYTVKISLRSAMPAFLNFVAFGKYASILPKDEVLKHGNLQKVMIGTGPFKLKEYRHGVSATYVRNDDYWEPGLPYIDGFDLVVVKDETSRLAGIRMGTYDISWVKGPLLGTLAAKESHLMMEMGPAGRLGHLFFNHSRFPFNNMKLRQAVAACIDRQAINNKVLLGTGKLATIFAPEGNPFSLSQEEIGKLPYYKQDYDLAKKRLKEAGYPNGFEFTIKTNPHSPDYVQSCEIIVEQLAKVGIKAKIQQVEYGAFQKVRRSRDHEVIYYATSWKPDPIGYFDKNFHSKSSGNELGLSDPEIDRLIDLCSAEPDFKKLKQYFRELQHKAAEKVLTISTYASTDRYEIMKTKVKNYHITGDKSRVFLRQAWISQ
jgi:peptide/nickel transport system substrate-binding protein